MFLKSRTHFFSHTKFSSARGFTLVELLVSIAIIVIITSMVLLRYDKFDSTILLKNTAYDIALTLREAQVRSVSAMRGGASQSKYPYGVTFTPGLVSGKEYTTFRYNDEIAYPKYDGVTTYDVLKTTIDRTMFVSAVCIYGTTIGNPCDADRLDISFRRPEYRALFYATDGIDIYSTDITDATIVLESPKGNEKFEVNISGLGQITVKKQ